MSHFLLGVVLPNEVEPNETYIDRVMEPYDESCEVEEYERDCVCGDWEANRLADQLATKRTGLTWDGLREEFNRRPMAERSDQAWQDFRRPLMEATEAARAELDAKPDPDCSDCHGSGHYTSTYNPDSKWDRYRIGGRWDGEIAGKPADSADGGFNFSPEHERLDNNIARVKDMATVPFAILTPDGEWHERGQMGWWGIAHNEKPDDAWAREVEQIKAAYGDHHIVGVDCHI